MWQTSLQKRRVSGMGSCWRFSTLKSIRVIAFMDLIDAIIFTVYRSITLMLLLARIPTNKSSSDSSGVHRNSGSGSAIYNTPASVNRGMNHSHFNYNYNPGIGKSISGDESDSHSMDPTYMRYWSVLLLTGIVITFAVEVFLFLLLNSGAPMRNLRHCKNWVFLRVLLLLFSIIKSVIDLKMGEYTLISGLLEVEKIYRVGTLLIMWKFMDEVKAGDFDNSKLNCNIAAEGSSNYVGSYSQAP